MEYILTLFLFATNGAFITKTHTVMADKDMCHREQHRLESRKDGVAFAACNPRVVRTEEVGPSKLGF